MVKRQFTFDEIKDTIRVKNVNMYTGKSIVFDGKNFVTKQNKDVFYYYVLDMLDSLDYQAFGLKDPSLIDNLERYDNRIRCNDKIMRSKIESTINLVRDLQDKTLL
jgi:hypothetical protein